MATNSLQNSVPCFATAPNCVDPTAETWLSMVDQTRTEQPHYVAPIITTHVLLVQQFRFNSYDQQAPHGVETDEYGGMKGLEIIPNSRMEVQVGVPPYFFHQSPTIGRVWRRLHFSEISSVLSARRGRRLLRRFLPCGEFPSGSLPNGMGHTIWSPMLAAAKGWSWFDVQSTLNGSLPQSGTPVLGRQILFNNRFQFKLFGGKLWPEVETNTTFFVDGPIPEMQKRFSHRVC
jgi:hypothetical protein